MIKNGQKSLTDNNYNEGIKINYKVKIGKGNNS